MILTIVVAIFVLGVLILVHEAGHFAIAKLVGIRVHRFSIGLGKPLVSYRKGETEYSLSAIPFGGYVKMAGEEPTEGLEGEEPTEEEYTEPARRFDNKSVPARFAVIFAGPFSNFLLAVVLFIGILYFQGAQTYATTRMESVAAELALPGTEELRGGSTILQVNGGQVERWDQVVEEITGSRDGRTTIALAGPDGSPYQVEIATPNDSLRAQLAASLVPQVEPRIGSLVPSKPAAEAGLQRGDLILAVDGEPVESWQELTRLIRAKAEQEMQLLVQREGKELTVAVAPELTSVPNAEGKFEEVGLIGIGPQMGRVELGPGEAVVTGARNAALTTVVIAQRLWQLLAGLVSGGIPLGEARNVLGGPVMIGQLAGESARAGELWYFMAILSINLAILNLLPIPVLDGGHLLFLLIEVARFGRPLSQQARDPLDPGRPADRAAADAAGDRQRPGPAVRALRRWARNHYRLVSQFRVCR